MNATLQQKSKHNKTNLKVWSKSGSNAYAIVGHKVATKKTWCDLWNYMPMFLSLRSWRWEAGAVLKTHDGQNNHGRDKKADDASTWRAKWRSATRHRAWLAKRRNRKKWHMIHASNHANDGDWASFSSSVRTWCLPWSIIIIIRLRAAMHAKWEIAILHGIRSKIAADVVNQKEIHASSSLFRLRKHVNGWCRNCCTRTRLSNPHKVWRPTKKHNWVYHPNKQPKKIR